MGSLHVFMQVQEELRRKATGRSSNAAFKKRDDKTMSEEEEMHSDRELRSLLFEIKKSEDFYSNADLAVTPSDLSSSVADALDLFSGRLLDTDTQKPDEKLSSMLDFNSPIKASLVSSSSMKSFKVTMPIREVLVSLERLRKFVEENPRLLPDVVHVMGAFKKICYDIVYKYDFNDPKVLHEFVNSDGLSVMFYFLRFQEEHIHVLALMLMRKVSQASHQLRQCMLQMCPTVIGHLLKFIDKKVVPLTKDEQYSSFLTVELIHSLCQTDQGKINIEQNPHYFQTLVYIFNVYTSQDAFIIAGSVIKIFNSFSHLASFKNILTEQAIILQLKPFLSNPCYQESSLVLLKSLSKQKQNRRLLLKANILPCLLKILEEPESKSFTLCVEVIINCLKSPKMYEFLQNNGFCDFLVDGMKIRKHELFNNVGLVRLYTGVLWDFMKENKHANDCIDKLSDMEIIGPLLRHLNAILNHNYSQIDAGQPILQNIIRVMALLIARESNLSQFFTVQPFLKLFELKHKCQTDDVTIKVLRILNYLAQSREFGNVIFKYIDTWWNILRCETNNENFRFHVALLISQLYVEHPTERINTKETNYIELLEPLWKTKSEKIMRSVSAIAFGLSHDYQIKQDFGGNQLQISENIEIMKNMELMLERTFHSPKPNPNWIRHIVLFFTNCLQVPNNISVIRKLDIPAMLIKYLHHPDSALIQSLLDIFQIFMRDEQCRSVLEKFNFAESLLFLLRQDKNNEVIKKMMDDFSTFSDQLVVCKHKEFKEPKDIMKKLIELIDYVN